MIYRCLSCGAKYHAEPSNGAKCTVPFVVPADGSEYACGGPVVPKDDDAEDNREAMENIQAIQNAGARDGHYDPIGD